MEVDISQHVTADHVAKTFNVPLKAVLNAIALHKIHHATKLKSGEYLIPASQLEGYEFDLIGVIEYAKRKGVTPKAVYKRTASRNPEIQILYTVEEISDLIKIDWELYKDIKFKAYTYRHRSKKKVA